MLCWGINQKGKEGLSVTCGRGRKENTSGSFGATKGNRNEVQAEWLYGKHMFGYGEKNRDLGEIPCITIKKGIKV